MVELKDMTLRALRAYVELQGYDVRARSKKELVKKIRKELAKQSKTPIYYEKVGKKTRRRLHAAKKEQETETPIYYEEVGKKGAERPRLHAVPAAPPAKKASPKKSTVKKSPAKKPSPEKQKTYLQKLGELLGEDKKKGEQPSLKDSKIQYAMSANAKDALKRIVMLGHDQKDEFLIFFYNQTPGGKELLRKFIKYANESLRLLPADQRSKLPGQLEKKLKDNQLITKLDVTRIHTLACNIMGSTKKGKEKCRADRYSVRGTLKTTAEVRKQLRKAELKKVDEQEKMLQQRRAELKELKQIEEQEKKLQQKKKDLKKRPLKREDSFLKRLAMALEYP